MRKDEKKIFYWSDLKADRARVRLHCFGCMRSKPFNLTKGMRDYGDLRLAEAEELITRFKCINCGNKQFSWVVEPYEGDE